MRIEALLADLEAQHAAAERHELRAEVAQGVRAERARITTRQRLDAALGRPVVVSAAGVDVAGTLAEIGDGWLAISADRETTAASLMDIVRPGMRVIAIDAIESVTGLGRLSGPSEPQAPRLGMGWGAILRAVAQGRSAVAWRTRTGAVHTGVIQAVGKDHVILTKAGSEDVVLTVSGLCVLAPMAGHPDLHAPRQVGRGGRGA